MNQHYNNKDLMKRDNLFLDTDIQDLPESLKPANSNKLIKLKYNSFIGVCYTANRIDPLAWYVQEDEEYMISIEDIILVLKDEEEHELLEQFTKYQQASITEVVILRGW